MVSQRQKAKKIRRQRDRDAWARHLLSSQKGLCHWCGSRIWMVTDFPLWERREVSSTMITLADGSKRWIATVDHLTTFSGRRIHTMSVSCPTRIVMSCQPCNHARTHHKDFKEWLRQKKMNVAHEK